MTLRPSHPGEWRCQITGEDFGREMFVRVVRENDPGPGIPGHVLALDAVTVKMVDDSHAIPIWFGSSQSETRGFLQAIVDAAWDAGIKPSAIKANPPRPAAPGIGATDVVDAMQGHLDLIRKMVADFPSPTL